MNVEWQRWLLSAEDPDDLTVEVDVLLDEQGRVLPHMRLMANFVSVRSGWEAGAVISPDGSVQFVETSPVSDRTCNLWLHGACFNLHSIQCEIDGKALDMTPLGWEMIA